MKRDLDLLRDILLSVEAFAPKTIGELQAVQPSDFSGTEPENFHHIKLLIDAGLIDLAGPPTLKAEFSIRGMTMAGHDFLDAIREQSVWDQTKDRIGTAGGWTLDIVLAVAKEEIKRRLGLALD